MLKNSNLNPKPHKIGFWQSFKKASLQDKLVVSLGGIIMFTILLFAVNYATNPNMYQTSIIPDVSGELNLRVTPDFDHFNLYWNEITGVDRYEIMRRDGFAGRFELIDQTTASNYLDQISHQSTIFGYSIIAYKGDQKISESEEIYSKLLTFHPGEQIGYYLDAIQTPENQLIMSLHWSGDWGLQAIDDNLNPAVENIEQVIPGTEQNWYHPVGLLSMFSADKRIVVQKQYFDTHTDANGKELDQDYLPVLDENKGRVSFDNYIGPHTDGLIVASNDVDACMKFNLSWETLKGDNQEAPVIFDGRVIATAEANGTEFYFPIGCEGGTSPDPDPDDPAPIPDCGDKARIYFGYETQYPEYAGAEFCSEGYLVGGVEPNFPDPGQTINWSCANTAGDSIGCTATRMDADDPDDPAPAPECGDKARIYFANEEQYPEYLGAEFCDKGNLVGAEPNFPNPGQTINWSCANTDGDSIGCTAVRMATDSPDIIATCGINTGNYEYGETTWNGSERTDFCATGNLVGSIPIFPQIGQSISWVCQGTTEDQGCQAHLRPESSTPYIIVTPETSIVKVGETGQLVVSLLENGTTADITDVVTWNYEENNFINFNQGQFTGIAPGEVILNIDFKGLEAIATIKVIEDETKYLLANPRSVVLMPEDSIDIKVRLMSSNGDGEAIENEQLKWQSENSEIAIVKKGRITANSLGDTVITVMNENGLKDLILVKVRLVSGPKLVIRPASLNYTYEPENQLVKPNAKPDFKAFYIENGEERDVSKRSIWSADERVAKIEGGFVTAVKVGSTEVTATYQDLVASARLNVVEEFVEPDPNESVSLTITAPLQGRSTTSTAHANHADNLYVAIYDMDGNLLFDNNGTSYSTNGNGTTAEIDLPASIVIGESYQVYVKTAQHLASVKTITTTSGVNNISYERLVAGDIDGNPNSSNPANSPHNNTVNNFDLSVFYPTWGSNNELMDINGNGEVGAEDISWIIKNQGEVGDTV